MIYHNLKIIDTLLDSRGVAKKDKITIFVDNAIIGEVVDAEITKSKKNYLEAKKVKTIKESPFYRKPPCPYFYECGGCSIMNLNYKKQLDLKKKLIINQLNKIAKIDIENLEIKPTYEFSYRNKISLKIDKNSKLSYYHQKTHKYVNIDDCLLATDYIRTNLPIIQSYITCLYKNGIKADELVIRSNDKDILLIVKIKNIKHVDIKLMTKLAKEYDFNIVLSDKRKDIIIKGKDYIYMIYKDKKYKISCNSFYQVNKFQLVNLYDKAHSCIKKDDILLDLYCGVGSSTISLKDDNIIGVEINKKAIKDAIFNVKINNIENYKFIADDSKNIDNKLIEKINPTIISVDPPRGGLDNKLIDSIKTSKVDRLIYISCNPSTLARDLRSFKESFYIYDIEAFDMFAQTMHVETFVYLKRKR
ncbi:MAG: 23S rRNA (uracil(1939)-C(5))-methyltransferase RlmD [Tissierellia bacterium]|nr:23S rRNA (uracil(1939)-C(5))-methyltransferase RlmD [Tissierellia bacterium]